MGDVLPPKRQTGVERLKRRFELYRRHQNACLPRYEQAENGLYEIQRQETLLLKQRYLESKAKKAKSNKSEHHRSYKESVTDSCKAQVHTKPLKRPVEEPISNPSIECTNNEDTEKPSKLLRTDTTSDKLDLKPPQKPSQQPQSSLPSFSVQIVQQFTNAPHNQQSQTLQTNVTVQTLNKPLSSPISQPASNKSSQEPGVNVTEPQQVNTQLLTTIECKQEKDSNQGDLCQFKNEQNTTSDRLSDTFPSLGFTDESGDDVYPDLLKDLIDDVFTNPADIMKDFNFDDSVGSMKDHDDDTKDIISDLIKESSPMPIRPFQTDNLTFVNNSVCQQSQQQQQTTQQQKQQQQQQQQSSPQPNVGLFKNMPPNNEVPVSVIITTTPTSTTTSNFYNATAQRLPSYGNSSINIPSGLNLDFKINEPNPAALTLKQMAEQHQNMQQKQQQQQLVNSALSNRSFNQDTYNPHINQLRSTGNYLPGTSPKTASSSHVFNTFDRQMNSMNNFANNEPLNNLPISPNNIFDSRASNVLSEIEHSKQSSCLPVQQQQIHHQQQHQHLQQDHHPPQLQQKQPSQQQSQPPQQQQQQQQQKPPAYSSPRQLPHFTENSQLRLQKPLTNQHQVRPVGRQFPNNMQIVQTQILSNQGHLGVQQVPPNSHVNQQQQQQHHMMPHSGQYTNFSSQQSINNPTFHVSMSQNIPYSAQFNSSNQAMNNLHHANRPPPEYKAHQPSDNVNLIDQLKAPSPQVIFNHSAHKDNLLNKHQRAPNVTITADGSVIRTSSAMDWRHMINEHQNRGNPTFRNNYTNSNFGRSEHPVQQSQIFNQYRMQENQMISNHIIRPNMMPNQMLMQQRPRVSAPHRPRNQSPLEQHSSVGIASNSALPSLSSSFHNRHDINRSDGMLNLDFLDNIESSASDLLNFDQVMQEGTTTFPLLDDMEILGK